jgi:hypothetical protein
MLFTRTSGNSIIVISFNAMPIPWSAIRVQHDLRAVLRTFGPSCFTSCHRQTSPSEWYSLCGPIWSSNCTSDIPTVVFYKPASIIICFNVISTPWSANRLRTTRYRAYNTLWRSSLVPYKEQMSIRTDTNTCHFINWSPAPFCPHSVSNRRLK